MKKALFILLTISTVVGQTFAQNNTFPGIGSVGIGTTTPLAKLQVTTTSTSAGDNTASFSAPNIGGNFSHIHYGSTGDWYIRSASSSGKIMLQDLGGNVGVGTDIPTAKFEIVGSGFQFRLRHPAEGEKGWGLTLKQLDDLSGAIEMGGRNLKISSGWDKTLFLGAPEYNSNGGKVVFPGGKVGIGTLNPLAKLDITSTSMIGLHVGGNSSAYQGSDINITRSNTSSEVGKGAALQFNDNGSGSYNIIQSSTAGLQFFNQYNGTGWVERMRINGNGDTYFSSGKVGIGTTALTDDYHLSVNGKIKTKEVKVTQLNWSDYVFYDDYKLKPLSEVESFIRENKHLPDVPSAAEVEKEGINVGEMDALLLKKIEELTLYMIEIKKENEALKNEIGKLKSKE